LRYLLNLFKRLGRSAKKIEQQKQRLSKNGSRSVVYHFQFLHFLGIVGNTSRVIAKFMRFCQTFVDMSENISKKQKFSCI